MLQSSQVPSADRPPVPRLLTEWEPGYRVFWRNLCDLFGQPGPRLPLARNAHAAFWGDVFVETPLPRRALTQSGLWHIFAVVTIYGLSITWSQAIPTQSPFHNRTITYYSVAEYLPALQSPSEPAPQPRRGEPKLARQQIISLHRNPDNFRQTIIDPSTPKMLKEDRPMPNLVVWTPAPAPPVVGGLHAALTLPKDLEVIAPPPDASRRNLMPLAMKAATPDVIAPPPEQGRRDLARTNLPNVPLPGVVEPAADANLKRKLGEMNMAALQNNLASPRLAVEEQRSAGAGVPGGGSGTAQASVPPPPNISSGGAATLASGRLIALSVDPSTLAGPIVPPDGNRRGQFAIGPEGKPDAPGTPDIAGGGNGPGGRGRGLEGGAGSGDGGGDGPAGITITGGSHAPLLAAVVASPSPAPPPASSARSATPPLRRFPSLPPPRVSDVVRDMARQSPSLPPPVHEGNVEDEVFGSKRYYQMAINMPNLTSAGGSWIVRFAELEEKAAKGELVAPIATMKVDPAYPPELMRDKVEGTVTLYAVIHSDGSVGEVRVLEGVDKRLDENARVALARWHFRPATKNGAAIALEAVVKIPFKVGRLVF